MTDFVKQRVRRLKCGPIEARYEGTITTSCDHPVCRRDAIAIIVIPDVPLNWQPHRAGCKEHIEGFEEEARRYASITPPVPSPYRARY